MRIVFQNSENNGGIRTLRKKKFQGDEGVQLIPDAGGLKKT
jgi:hypothetical protein